MSKKIFRTLIPVFIAALLVFTAAGCAKTGGANTGSANSGGGNSGGSSDIAGEYHGELDMTETMSESSGLDIQTKLAMKLDLTLESDGKYSVIFDTEKFIADTIAYYNTEMPSLIKQSLINEGYSEEEIETVVKSQGYNSFEEFAAALLDQTISQVEKQFENSDPTVSEGTYKVDGNTLSLNETHGDSTLGNSGTIGSDGSISFKLSTGGKEYDIVFVK